MHVIFYLQELEFYITPSVIPGKNTLRSIVEGAGGRVLVKQPPVRTIRTNKTSMVRYPASLMLGQHHRQWHKLTLKMLHFASLKK